MPPAPTLPAGCECYLVGGAVRDRLLQRNTGDRDYVVTGATPEAMRAAGFKPVGADFPVFIHPRTGEEYALARTERKTAPGYRGFVFHSAPSVTLAEDLKRRDLTINALAEDADGEIIDYHGGQEDIRARVLRHVSDAFGEDPVRILRAARFAAMLPDFTIAEETMALMRRMVADGEAAHLRRERVWRELSLGLTAARPSRMINALDDCGALALLLPEVAALRDIPERLDYHPEGNSFVHTKMVTDAAAARGGTAAECFAALLHDTGKAQTPKHILPSHHGHEARSGKLAAKICARLKPPGDARDMAILAAKMHGKVHGAPDMRAATVVNLLTRADAFRRPQRFESLLRVCEADFYFRPERAGRRYKAGDFLRAARRAAAAVAAGDIAAAAGDKNKIAEAVRQARIEAVAAVKADLQDAGV